MALGNKAVIEQERDNILLGLASEALEGVALGMEALTPTGRIAAAREAVATYLSTRTMEQAAATLELFDSEEDMAQHVAQLMTTERAAEVRAALAYRRSLYDEREEGALVTVTYTRERPDHPGGDTWGQVQIIGPLTERKARSLVRRLISQSDRYDIDQRGTWQVTDGARTFAILW